MERSMYRVVEGHRASYPYAMVASEGDEVSIGREDPDMPGWFWCKDKKSVEMWAPETYLAVDGIRGRFTRSYNSTELNVVAGETVQCLGETLGWAECVNDDGRRGWIPLSKLRPVSL